MKRWTIDDSADLYGMHRWGEDFLTINDRGDLCVIAGPHSVSLNSVIERLSTNQIDLPVLLRFPDVLRQRVDRIACAFSDAIDSLAYEGSYRGVFPIKVNQERAVVRDMVEALRPHNMGLEAGSKPELLIVLAELDDPNAIIVCNGYKDSEYIETAMVSQALGRRPFLVVEKPSELDEIIAISHRLGVRPFLGVRAKLSSRGTGRWQSSSGDRAKFGLDAAQIVSMVDDLEAAGMLDCLQLLHFHIGSQVSAIRAFKDAVNEAGRIYVELVKLGAPMGFLDVGGGLGVDYEGSQTNSSQSINYTIEEYAEDIVDGISRVTNEAGVPHPHIVTEAGRAMVAHHAILVAEAIGVQRVGTAGDPDMVANDDPAPLVELAEIGDWLEPTTVQQAWHDALSCRDAITTLFKLGLIDLRQRAVGEELFWRMVSEIRDLCSNMEDVPSEVAVLPDLLADVYTMNFSLFQSMPDAWAIDQIFPIMPISRLNKKPDRPAILADLTCDSDGKLDRFVSDQRTLPLHGLDGNPYRLGFFLVGAYQEILGDLHNLFGDTHAVQVRLGPNASHTIEHFETGDTVSDVLSYVHFDADQLQQTIQHAADEAVSAGHMSTDQSDALIRAYQEGLRGYTYFESPSEG